MRVMKWLGTVAAFILLAVCFYPWVKIESKNIMVRGVDAASIGLGKPAYLHFILIFFFLLFTFTPKIWAKRSNLLVTALNLGWALRNYFVLITCQGGECPDKQLAIYMLIPASALMLFSALFSDVNLKKIK